MDVLDADNIFTDEEIGKILGDISADDTGEDKVNEEVQEDDEPVVEELEDEFSDTPESVGNDKEPPARPEHGSPTPQNQNLFHSIAAALREEGVFPDLDDDTLKGVNDAGSFRDLINRQIEAGLTEQQKRISNALSNGVQPDEVQQYEGALAFLDQVTEEALTANNSDGEELRKRIIYQDLINRGYSNEKAIKEIKKSLDAGTDIDDARDALQGNREYFQSRYNALLDNAKAQRQQAEEAYNQRAERFKKSLMEDNKVFGSVDIDKDTRRRVLDVLTKPTKRDDSGKYYTELQWAQKEDADQFSRNVGLLYVLTDGFKNVDKLIGQQVKQRTRQGLAELERVINDTQRNPDGSLNLLTGVSTDSNSFFDGDFELDI
jgi:hypothetical protein